jgi:glycosyltransferase involved in cell wall biosynthesis
LVHDGTDKLKQQLATVIVPVYNSERYLEDTLKSIFNQDYQPIEVIVVDDGSTDSSAKIAKSFKNIRYIYQANQGPSAARNTGITISQGEFIAFLDSDDMWMPEKLSLQINYLLNHPDVGFVVAHRRMLIEQGIKRPLWYKEHIFQKDSVCFGASAMLAWRNTFKEVGPYNPSYRFGENAEWLTRAKDAGVRYSILPETLLISRVHDKNLTHHLNEMRPNILRALKASIDRQRSKNISQWMNNNNGQ